MDKKNHLWFIFLVVTLGLCFKTLTLNINIDIENVKVDLWGSRNKENNHQK